MKEEQEPSTTMGIYHRIENLKNMMDNMERFDDVEITFVHERAFEVSAIVRAKDETTMNRIAGVHSLLTQQGFEEVSSNYSRANEWEYEWHHSNY